MGEKVVTGGNMFLRGTAFEAVAASWGVTAGIAFKDPVNDGTPD